MFVENENATIKTRSNAVTEHADACFSVGHHHDAIASYRRVLELQPDDVHALHRLGLASFRVNEPEQSREYLDAALICAPDRYDIWEHRGLIAALEGDRVAAEAFYHRALALNGHAASVHRNLGDLLKLSARLAEARDCYLKALELEPSLHHAARSLARIGTMRGDHAEAADFWLRAASLDPGNVEDLPEFIAALRKATRDAQLDALLPAMRAQFAGNAAALEQLAFALNGAQRFGDAASVAVQGIAVDPCSAWLHHNASFALNMQGECAAMYGHAAEAARLLPGNPLMQFNLAAAQLRAGNFERGWRQYVWHDALPENRDLVQFDYPQWQGEPVAGSRFLLVGEQGLGDQIQFLRMADWLHRRGAKVDVWVLPALGEVARGAAGVHAAWTTRPPGPYDFWCRMFRMPVHMNLTLPMLPLSSSYLAARPGVRERWRRRLGALATPPSNGIVKKRVGIVWAGNPAYGLDCHRSIALEAWQPVLRQGGIEWFSLQKGDAEHEAHALAGTSFDLRALGPEIRNLSDTLAIIQSLDLVITVDTAVAHLAGASGTPVWILVPTFTDWRWMLEREDSPWYPSARLFRQRELGNWHAVLADVAEALRAG